MNKEKSRMKTKWEYITNRLQEQGFSEEIIAKAHEIDKVVRDLCGDATLTDAWVADYSGLDEKALSTIILCDRYCCLCVRVDNNCDECPLGPLGDKTGICHGNPSLLREVLRAVATTSPPRGQ